MHALKITITDELDWPRDLEIICNGTPDAPCRRRPPNHEELESWTDEEATETGFECNLIEWVEASDYQTPVEKPLTITIPIDYEWDGEGIVIVPPSPPTQTLNLDN